MAMQIKKVENGFIVQVYARGSMGVAETTEFVFTNWEDVSSFVSSGEKYTECSFRSYSEVD
jgi:hypothetical protein